MISGNLPVNASHDELSDNQPSVAQPTLSIDLIQTQLKNLVADPLLAESDKKQIEGFYQTALEQLQTAAIFDVTAHSYQQLIDDGMKSTLAIRQKLSQLEVDSMKPRLPDDASDNDSGIRQFELQLQTDQAKLQSLENGLIDLNHQLQEQIARPRQIQLEQQKVVNKLSLLQNTLNTMALVNPQNYPVYNAELLAIKSTRQAAQAQNQMLVMELGSHQYKLAYIRSRYDYAIAEIAILQARIETVEQFLNQYRETEANQFSREMADALHAAAGKHSLILDTIRENLNLGNEYKNISLGIASARAQRDEVELKTQQINHQAEKAQRMLSLTGISPNLVSALREQRRALYAFTDSLVLTQNHLNQQGDLSVRQFETGESLKALQDIHQAVENKLLAYSLDSDSSHEIMSTKIELLLLFKQQHDQLEKINQTYTEYLGILEHLGINTQQLTKISDRYANYLDKNLLWVKSASPLTMDYLSHLNNALIWLFTTDHWHNAMTSVLPAARQQLVKTCLILLTMLGLLTARPAIKKRLQLIEERVGLAYSDTINYTFENIVLIILLVIPIVICVYFIGWLLVHSGDGNAFNRALGNALISISTPVFFLQAFYHFFTTGGIADKQLRWPECSISIMRTQIRWLRFVAVGCLFLIALTNHQNIINYSASIGRLALIILLIAISVALSKTLHPGSGVLRRHLNNHPHTWLSKTSFFWYPLVSLMPLVFAIIAAMGYVVSALELEHRMVASIRLILIAIIVHELALRGLRLFNRNLAIKKYLEKKQSDKTAQVSGEVGETILPTNPDELDISTINKQTRRLLWLSVMTACLFGFWLVWKDLLPALGILEDFELWKKSLIIAGVSTLHPVTLAHLLRALSYLVFAIVAIKNLPGVLEVLILNRLTIETGSRFALIQLINYSLIAITIVMVASELGGQWSQVQWLVAALGVGLGFGLQEIFANFVSGIILLFERPIRIGDTVTVGDVTGTVSRIQIRATTVTDWDRKDLVVPNKNFITDQLVNWTRTDNITRIVINLGIAYGSDTQTAHDIITKILKQHPMVLSDPQPMVFFIGFGDSSLDFEIRLFVKDVINRLPLIHDMHMKIDAAFRENGIEIPFPQRDLHLYKT